MDESFGELIREQLREGGPWMVPIGLIGLLGGVLSIGFVLINIWRDEKSLSHAAILLSGATAALFLAALATIWSHARAEAVLATVSPADAPTVRRASESEIANLRIWAYAGSALPLLCAGILLGIGLSRLDRFKSM